MKKPFPALLCLILMAGCVGPTPYEPRGAEDRRWGYADQKLDDTHVRVSFAGNAQTPRETVENYLLYRAAEVTKAAGHRYFVATAHDTRKDTSYTGFFDPAFAGGFGYGYGYPGYGGGAVVEETPVSEYDAELTIIMTDTKKADDPNAYDAAEVLKALSPLVQRPTATAPN